MTGPEFAFAFARNTRVIEMQANGIDHEASLRQSEAGFNCFNWVVGHIAAGRDDLLTELGGEPVLNAAIADRYRRESDPVTGDGPDVARFEDLVNAVAESGSRLEARLRDLTDEQLGEVVAEDGKTTLSRRLQFFWFHDTYHTGQTELLRRVSGRHDRVI